MINKPLPFKGLNIGIPIIIPVKGRGLLIRGWGYPEYQIPAAQEILNSPIVVYYDLLGIIAVRHHASCKGSNRRCDNI